MKTACRRLALTTALALTGGLANAQSGPQCPAGTAPQTTTTTHQVCVGRPPVGACYTYTSTQQNCQPLPPPPSSGPKK